VAGQDNVFAVLRDYRKTHIDSMFVFLANVSLPVVSSVGTCAIRTVFAVCGRCSLCM